MLLQFLVALFFSSLSYADSSCSEVRLDKNGGPLENIPVYNQKLYTETDTDICYAVTAATLLDAERARKGDKLSKLTSPLSLAVNYKFRRDSAKVVGPDGTGKCDYLIRDSYGSSCKDANGKDRYAYPCENGSVWVPLEEIAKNTSELTYFNVSP